MAVAAARQSFEDGRWRHKPLAERKKILHRIADLIDQEALDLAVLGVRDNGTEIGMALKAEPGSAADTFRFYAETVDKISGEIVSAPEDILALVHRAPVGVIGAIVPWNFPLMIGAWKLAPALAAGNSVVLKPSENASLTLLRLVELAHEAGLPDGVLNIVTGPGKTVGKALATSDDVDVLVFTGSGVVGRKLLEYSAASNLKRVYLELGGKSPNIIFSDTDNIHQAANVAAGAIFRNSGQVCVAGSRLLVQAGIYEQFVELVAKSAAALQVGDPLNLSTDIGAVNSLVQLDANLGYVDRAIQQGANLVTGGCRIREETGGYYMEPTIFSNVENEFEIVRSEVFGPVLCVIRFETEEEALTIANKTDYGLAAGVWTSNLSRAHRMIKRIKAGQIFVNAYGGAGITMPLSGHKQSGNGSDKSMHALDKFLDLKSAWIRL